MVAQFWGLSISRQQKKISKQGAKNYFKLPWFLINVKIQKTT